MGNKDTDIFESARSSNGGTNFSNLFEEDNPFVKMSAKQDNLRHINDYDFNILKEGAYKDISDDVFKLEYKISRAEEEIKAVETQIESAREIQDLNRINELQNKLYSLKDDYKTLLTLYNDKTLSAKITDSVSDLVKKTTGTDFKTMRENFAEVFDTFLSKMPKQISSIFKIKKSLSMLENINKSVDELVTMTIPYGENIDKYNQLSKYIIKANSIQAEISGYLGKRI